MKFRRTIDILTIFFVVIVLAAIFFHSCQRQKLTAEITSLSDENYLLNVLSIRGADDCKVMAIEGGWKCTEFKSGKIFIVRRP
jgi:hypothetical protein